MERSVNRDEMRALIQSIKAKYEQYHRQDRDRYPDFEFNSNRFNYQPLRDSFEVEFYEVRHIDRINNHLHIPSLHTLAQLFTNDEYVPRKKILNTCRSYAEGSVPQIVQEPKQPVLDALEQTSPGPVSVGRPVRLARAWLITSLLVLLGLTGYLVFRHQKTADVPSVLTLTTPAPGRKVPRLLTVGGKATNADTVWVVVHPSAWDKNYPSPLGWSKYYVQPPIKVNADGIWKGLVYIGGLGEDDIGVRYQVRAFVKPAKKYQVLEEFERDIFSEWPAAESSTEAVEVVRGK